MINLPTDTIDHQVKMKKNILERIPTNKISNGIYVFVVAGPNKKAYTAERLT